MNMKLNFALNGWRRIGIVLVTGWLIVLLFLVIYGEDTSAYGLISIEVEETRSFPIPAPELKAALEAKKVQKLGRELKPWEMEWNPTREGHVQLRVSQLSASKLFYAAVLWPMLVWLLAECGTFVVRWVMAGFRQSALIHDADNKS